MSLPTNKPDAGRAMSPLALILRLFSSIRFGIILLALLFVYSALGSAGIGIPWVTPFLNVRELPWLEMTEFEWFHWWPFDLLIGLICLNLTVATLRRIKFKPVNYGVWMIHSGIIILCIGSVIYFSTKVEGDAPVIRRRVVIELSTGESATLEAIPGNEITIGEGEHAYTARISSIDPEWELLSGDDKGKRAYLINVSMQAVNSDERFIRQLLVGYPQYTEDLIPSSNPQQPFARAVKEIGTPLANESITMRLEYEPQEYFYLAANLTKCFALYVRPLGENDWIERPIEGMPMFNDRVADRTDVWVSADTPFWPFGLDLAVPPVRQGDPLPEVRVTSYLKYAFMEERKLPGGEKLDPVVAVRVRMPGRPSEQYTLAALDPMSNVAANGQLQFRWIESEEELDVISEVIAPALIWTNPETGETRELAITDVARVNPAAPFLPIEGTEYSYRVEFLDQDLEFTPDRVASIAGLEVRTPERTFKRWISTDPTLNRDMPVAPADPHSAMPDMHEATLPFDEGLQLSLKPGKRPPAVSLLAGPGDDELRLMVSAGGAPTIQPIKSGERAHLPQEITLEVIRYAARTHTETRPFIVPRSQRDGDAGVHYSMVKVEIPGAGGKAHDYWIPYHHWAFKDANEALRRFNFRPAVVEGPDGRQYEMILSRQRLPLPNPIALDEFKLTTHVGGFTGDNVSVRDWTSVLRFHEDGAWSDPLDVSVNAPAEFGGLWYFQAQWDPPMAARFQGDASSAGLNYTVLGVGSRHGVNIQLAGCCIAVIGMIYAFYAKPYIRRRDRDRALAAARSRAENLTSDSNKEKSSARRPESLVPVGSPRQIIEGAQS